MSADKDSTLRHIDALVTSRLNGKAITGVHIWVNASVTLLEIGFSGGTQLFKFSQGKVETGGTADWGSGTLLNI